MFIVSGDAKAVAGSLGDLAQGRATSKKDLDLRLSARSSSRTSAGGPSSRECARGSLRMMSTLLVSKHKQETDYNRYNSRNSMIGMVSRFFEILLCHYDSMILID